MIAYLRSGALAAPRVVDDAEAGPADTPSGRLTSNVGDGELILEGASGDLIRLVWSRPPADDAASAADLARPVPAGTYTLRGYRVIERDDSGETWHLSGCGPSLGEVVVRAGETTHLEVDRAVHVGLRWVAHGGRFMAQVSIGGTEDAHGRRCGLTIYRSGRRIPLECALLDAAGVELASLPLRYG